MKTNIFIAPILCILFILAGCSNSVENVSFTGTWSVIKVNGIADQKSESTVRVIADRNKFMVSTQDPETVTVDIFDGKLLTHKITDTNSSNTVPKSDMEVAYLRFWKKSFSGDHIPGGLIAGRETLLYQSQENGFNEVTTIQTWVDAETNIILKRIFTRYSSQIEQVISKTTEECLEIHYGPVDGSVFDKL